MRRTDDTGSWAGDILDAKGITICEMMEPSPFPMAQEIVVAVNAHDDLVAQRDALVGASDSLYDTIQELRHMINGALSGNPEYDSLDAVMARGRANIKQYHAALALGIQGG